MELAKAYDPKKTEERIYKFWLRLGFFNPDKIKGKRQKAKGKSFVIVLPPPNITGSLHMGHALNAVVQDILIRKKRMEGYKTLWLPGTDHAGIAAQNVVERELQKRGLTRFDLGRKKFLELMWEWRDKYGNIILEQLKKLGVSCDWSRTRFTLDDKYVKAVETAFLHYYKKGWIYQDEKTINWCPRCQTSLSDLEVEYKEEPSQLYYIKYGPLTVATVRPETKLGDTAIAVNPKDKRYKKYIGKTLDIKTVLGPAKMKVIGDESVDMNFGTGVVKVTPAHDIHDFEIGQKHKLERKQVIGPDARMTKLAGKYAGMKVKEARRQIVEDMKKIGILEKVEPYTHNIARCYRCHTVLEPILSKQWFLKMDNLAELAVKAVRSGKVKFLPKRWEKIYFDWLKNIKDWCISRQIWWGHRLPVWFCQTDKLKLKVKNEKLKIIISNKKPKHCPFCKSCSMEQSEDVLDTWFSSALWPFATLGWPEKTKDLNNFYPTDVLSTDRGIINLWVARMIFSGLEFMKKPPFHTVYVHATVLTKEGKRMSKSLGTGVDPLTLIEKYGADATRWGIAWQIGDLQDIKFVEDHIIMGKKFCNKVWNAARFVLQQTSNSKFKNQKSKLQVKAKNLTAEDKKILKALENTTKLVNVNLENFQFGKAAQALYNFFWHDFCDKYLEKSKSQIVNSKSQENTKKILLYVLFTSLRLLHPFIPFITEEIYQKLPIRRRAESLMIENWPSATIKLKAKSEK